PCCGSCRTRPRSSPAPCSTPPAAATSSRMASAGLEEIDGRRYAARLFKFPFGGRASEYSEPPTVGAYLRAGNVYLHPNVKTTTGLWIFAEPVLVAGEGDDCVADQLLGLLSVRRQVVPHPKSWKGLTDPLMKAAKVRSYKAFVASAKYIEVAQEADTIS